jgi:hypothetical protein
MALGTSACGLAGKTIPELALLITLGAVLGHEYSRLSHTGSCPAKIGRTRVSPRGDYAGVRVRGDFTFSGRAHTGKKILTPNPAISSRKCPSAACPTLSVRDSTQLLLDSGWRRRSGLDGPPGSDHVVNHQ